MAARTGRRRAGRAQRATRTAATTSRSSSGSAISGGALVDGEVERAAGGVPASSPGSQHRALLVAVTSVQVIMGAQHFAARVARSSRAPPNRSTPIFGPGFLGCGQPTPRGCGRPPRAGVGQRRQAALDLRRVRLEPRRQDDDRAELLERDVDREAGRVVGDLEQHAAGLAEVDRVEVVAVDDAAVRDAGRLQQLVASAGARRRSCPTRRGGRCRRSGGRARRAPGRRRSCRRGARRAAPTRRRRRGPRDRTFSSSGAAALGVGRCRRARRRSPGARARRDLRVLGGQRLVDAGPDGQLVAEALEVGEPQRRRRRASVSTPSSPSRCSQKSSAAARRRRARRSCGPSRRPRGPGIAPGYSKNVSSEPGRPCSSA